MLRDGTQAALTAADATPHLLGHCIAPRPPNPELAPSLAGFPFLVTALPLSHGWERHQGVCCLPSHGPRNATTVLQLSETGALSHFQWHDTDFQRLPAWEPERLVPWEASCAVWDEGSGIKQDLCLTQHRPLAFKAPGYAAVVERQAQRPLVEPGRPAPRLAPAAEDLLAQLATTWADPNQIVQVARPPDKPQEAAAARAKTAARSSQPPRAAGSGRSGRQPGGGGAARMSPRPSQGKAQGPQQGGGVVRAVKPSIAKKRGRPKRVGF